LLLLLLLLLLFGVSKEKIHSFDVDRGIAVGCWLLVIVIL
jgi:hypothetical protein